MSLDMRFIFSVLVELRIRMYAVNVALKLNCFGNIIIFCGGNFALALGVQCNSSKSFKSLIIGSK